MTSRRPMTRSLSGNGRTSSFNDEDSSSSNGRSESRNTYLSNVRPENRSTLCSVMAQLTEDIQPSFETTLKSKAVSENCTVRFTCVVSGYPAPELKWYKDDMEMDRYCGLPKYEIRRNGKTHTLHIYNCTLDDAAIYQVSASNSKGIVSCSGVLEVGTMSEYKIHQRFFAKLKQKAENKKRELEESKRRGKENIQKEQARGSPDRSQRKRPISPPEESPAVREPEAVEQPGTAAVEPNGVSTEVSQPDPVTPTDNDMEKMEIAPTKSPSKETLAKKMKISNGLDAGVSSSSSSSNNSDSSRNHTMGNGGENSYDGGLSLAQFLAETLHSQAAEEKQNSLRGQKPTETDATNADDSKEKERELEMEEQEKERALVEEHEREKITEKELTMEREKERQRQAGLSHKTAHSAHASDKDHDHHNIQASISSVLHSVKDFFFGKHKKDSHDHRKHEEREVDHLIAPIQLEPSPPPSRQVAEHKPEVSEPLTEEVVPMEVGRPQEPLIIAVTDEQPVTLERLKAQENKLGVNLLHTEDLLPAHKPPSERAADSTEQRVEAAMEVTEVHVEVVSSGAEQAVSMPGPPALSEVAEEHSQTIPDIQAVPVLQKEQSVLVVSPGPDHQATADETQSSLIQDLSGLPQSQAPSGEAPTANLTSLRDGFSPPFSVISAIDNKGLDEVMTETLQGKDMHAGKMDNESDIATQENNASDYLRMDEKVEVKAEVRPCPDINRAEVTQLETPSLEERIETCDSKIPQQVPVILIMDENTMAPDEEEGDHLKTEVESTPCIQERNVESFATPVPENLENDYLNIPQECSPIAAGSIEGHVLNTKESSISALEGHKMESVLKEVFTFSIEENIEVNSLNKLKIQKQVVPKVESTEDSRETLERNEVPTLTIEREFKMEKKSKTQVTAEVFDESKYDSHTDSHNTQYEGGHVSVLEEPTKEANPDTDVFNVGGFIENVPEKQILNSAIEDIRDIKLIVPEVRVNEQMITPKIEIMEPDIKQPAILALSKPKSKPLLLQRSGAIEVLEEMLTEHGTAISSVAGGVIPPQKSMQNDEILPLTENVQDVAQLDDKTEMHNGEQLNKETTEQPPQTGYASVPIADVSYTDDSKFREDVHVFVTPPVLDTPQLDEAPKVPSFVVPDISIICDDSPPEIKLPTQNEHKETEPLVATLRGTQNPEALRHNITDSNPSMLYRTPVPTEITTNALSLGKPTEEITMAEAEKVKPLKEARTESDITAEELQRDKPSIERLGVKPPTPPAMSPASIRRFQSKAAPGSDTVMAVPAITVGDSQSDKMGDELSGGSTPTSSLSCESSPRLKRRDSLSLIRSATPEELASGARRKIFIPKPKGEEGEGVGVGTGAGAGTGTGTGAGAGAGALDTQGKKETPYMSPSQARRAALLQAPTGQQTPPMERRSPLLSRRKVTLEVPKVVEETPTEEPASTKPEDKPAEKEKLDPFKAPQVIRKIRGEPFPDASGHLKLWCQFFNVLSDSTIKWYRDEEEILEVTRSGGDESQVALAIVQASSQDCGVYGCSIKNEYGTDATDYLLSVDILSGILLKDDLEVGEEIEMTPLVFTKGLADTGCWGDKFFGRTMIVQAHLGEGCSHKASRVKVIYGLDPVFESGTTCIIKIQNPIAYGTKGESNLTERNLGITKQECKIQNMIREYCKIFAAEARVVDNFGLALEVLPQYLMYRPANSVPYATVETDVDGIFLKYCMMDVKGRLITRTVSEVEQKCCTFQHWIHQWTHGNLLVTQMEGVGAKITNVRVVTKSKGYQGLTEDGSPKVFEQFLTHHQCNYYCGLLSLRPLKTMDSLQQPTKIKGSRSPMLNRKLGPGSSSPQLQKKGTNSPQMSRKAMSSPKVPKKTQETEDNKLNVKTKTAETL